MKSVSIQVMEAVFSGIDRVRDIALRVGASEEVVHARLHDLKNLGLVRSIRMAADCQRGKPGRPPRRYLPIRVRLNP